MLTADKNARKTKRCVEVLTKGPLCFVNPGAFFTFTKGTLEYSH